MSQDRHQQKQNRSIECDNLKCNTITVGNLFGGNTAITGQFYAINGTALSPGYAFQSAADTGIYRQGAALALTINGVQTFTLTGAGNVEVGYPTATFSSTLVLGNDGTQFNHIRFQQAGLDVWEIRQRAGANPDLAIITTGTGILDLSAANQVFIPDGTVALPGLAFTVGVNTGIYKSGANDLSFTLGGINAFTFDNAGDFFFGNTATATATDLRIQNAASNKRISFWVAASEEWRISSAGALNSALAISNVTSTGNITLAVDATAEIRVISGNTFVLTAGVNLQLGRTNGAVAGVSICGTAQLVAGTLTVTQTDITAGSVILVSRLSAPAVALGLLECIPAVGSFTVNAVSEAAGGVVVTDTSNFAWVLFNL